jgi:ribonuclease HI
MSMLLSTQGTGEVAIGAVARDHSGALVATLSQTTTLCQDAEEAEAKALLAGLQMGINLNLEVSVVESDCVVVVLAANDSASNHSKNWSTYRDISSARS